MTQTDGAVAGVGPGRRNGQRVGATVRWNAMDGVEPKGRRVVNALEADPPDYVLLVHRNNAEHGARFFGVDFAQETRRWIDRNYTLRATFGQRPFAGRRFGIAILARSSSAPDGAGT